MHYHAASRSASFLCSRETGREDTSAMRSVSSLLTSGLLSLYRLQNVWCTHGRDCTRPQMRFNILSMLPESEKTLLDI